MARGAPVRVERRHLVVCRSKSLLTVLAPSRLRRYSLDLGYATLMTHSARC